MNNKMILYITLFSFSSMMHSMDHTQLAITYNKQRCNINFHPTLPTDAGYAGHATIENLVYHSQGPTTPNISAAGRQIRTNPYVLLPSSDCFSNFFPKNETDKTHIGYILKDQLETALEIAAKTKDDAHLEQKNIFMVVTIDEGRKLGYEVSNTDHLKQQLK